MTRLVSILALMLLVAMPAQAFNSASPYWMNLKSKLKKYLSATINPKVYKYKIIEPNIDMKGFVGNRPDANIRFERLNLGSPSHRKNLLASAYDANGRRIDSYTVNINVWVYSKVYMLRKDVKAGEDITSDNVYETTIPLKQMDQKLYFNGNIRQKVATRDIHRGEAIRKNMIRHEKIIQAGDSIKVTSGSQFIQLDFICKSMTSGDVGDTIGINCPDMQNRSKKAKVLGPGEARLI